MSPIDRLLQNLIEKEDSVFSFKDSLTFQGEDGIVKYSFSLSGAVNVTNSIIIRPGEDSELKQQQCKADVISQIILSSHGNIPISPEGGYFIMPVTINGVSIKRFRRYEDELKTNFKPRHNVDGID